LDGTAEGEVVVAVRWKEVGPGREGRPGTRRPLSAAALRTALAGTLPRTISDVKRTRGGLSGY